jgi:LmbE family N-acetylglucosaminyl deacetylase
VSDPRTRRYGPERNWRAWDALLARIGGGESASTPVRVAIIAAHPDDEIVSAGALLRRLSLSSGRLHALHVTDGAPRNGVDAQALGFRSVESYRRARRAELRLALSEAQIRCVQLHSIGMPDQQAAYSLPLLARTIAYHLMRHRVDIVLSHPFEGGHPDHDATAFAVHAAVSMLSSDVGPLIAEFTSYHAEGDGVRTGAFLNGSSRDEAVLTLDGRERSIKRRARDCFASQARVLAQFPLAHERFRIAPPYVFTEPPHAGRLFYEHFDWGLDGERWQRLASDALRALGFGPDVRL